MSDQTSFNKLGDENSAYLKQHKDNPVHWLPYGPEALQKSKEENKPIFLSIGYSSCHWCHVMAEESFTDEETAKILNENFVCIKVDREEYPDIDTYYQQACQLFIQAGGWPLNAFLLPDMRPFFAGTYFPKVRKGDQGPSFTELCLELSRAYKEEKDKVEENAAQVTEAIEKGLVPPEKIEYPNHFPAPMAIMEAVKEFADKEYGGYGQAPKFPHFSFYEWAIEQMLEGMIEQSHGQHIVDSMENMLMGGIVDHAKGGIHRYSVDEKFLVPHFEKMLYDQAGLLKTLAKLSMLYPSPLVFDTIMNTLDYLGTEMMSEEGYLFSGQNADSEGVEGLYFTYTSEEFDDLINQASDENDDLADKKEQIRKWFRIEEAGNFENKLNVISLNPECKEEVFTAEGWEIIRRIRAVIIEDRKGRIPPSTDNKGVASWNFMLVSALVDVMQYVQIDVIRKMASGLFNKSVEGMYKAFLKGSPDQGGTHLTHTTTKEASLPYLEDYATFCEAQLRIYEITGNPVFKKNLQDTLEFVTKEFLDGDKLLTRAKSATDMEIYPNQEATYFDNSFKSAAATLINVIRRTRILTLDKEVGGNIDELHDKVKNFALRNPLSAGEAMRASTYPDQAYRVVKLPAKWLDEGEFVNFMNYFLPRFVLDYHTEENESWQICNEEQCELQGEGLQNFIQTLRPPAPEEGQPS